MMIKREELTVSPLFVGRRLSVFFVFCFFIFLSTFDKEKEVSEYTTTRWKEGLKIKKLNIEV